MFKSIKPILIIIVLGCFSQYSFGQNTINSSGNWDDTGIWSGSNIADVLAEDVAFSGGQAKNATIRNGSSYTVGNIDLDKHGITIQSTGTLNIGASGSPRNLTANNGASMTVAGTLIIWGDVIVTNNLTWVISGTVIIKGNVIMGNNASFIVSGNLTVDGNFTGGSNTHVINSGNIAVGGAVSVGGGTTSLSNSGTFTAGSCSGVGTTFCSGVVVLPVILLFFEAKAYPEFIELKWATASELNFDRFVIEKTRDGKTFIEIGERQGAGVSTTRIDYSFTDENVLLGRTYYRLKAIDFDGFTEYFGVVTASFEGAEQISVVPNPANGNNVKFQLNFSTEDALYYSVLNTAGAEVYSSMVRSDGFDHEYSIEKTFASGFYFLVVQQGQERKVVRFVVN